MAVDKWAGASLVVAAAGAATSASPAWLQLVPAACSLLLGEAGGYGDHDGGYGDHDGGGGGEARLSLGVPVRRVCRTRGSMLAGTRLAA